MHSTCGDGASRRRRALSNKPCKQQQQAAESALIPSGEEIAGLKIYPGGTHSLGDTSKDQVNADLLAFIKAEIAVAVK